jgi:hypothetical protein
VRRATTILLLLFTLASVAGTAGAIRCDCCFTGGEAAMSGFAGCCPGGDPSSCGSPALKPGPSPEAARSIDAPRVVMLPQAIVSPHVLLTVIELEAAAAKPFGRGGLALRSILRI